MSASPQTFLIFLFGSLVAALGCGGGAPSGGGGAGGTGAGGEGGSGECRQLRADYANALELALACNPTLPDQCQQLTLPPDCTGCGSVVQQTLGPDSIRAQLIASGCAQPIDCPCISAGPVTCISKDGSASAGTCSPPPIR